MLSVLRDLCVQRTTLNVAHATLLVAVHTCSASQAAMYNAQRGTRNTFGGCAHLQCLTSCSVQCSTWHTQHFWWLCTLAVPHKLQRTMLNVARNTFVELARTIYIRCIYGIFGREITKYCTFSISPRIKIVFCPAG